MAKTMSILIKIVTVFVLISTVTGEPSALKTAAVVLLSIGWAMKAGIEIYELRGERK